MSADGTEAGRELEPELVEYIRTVILSLVIDEEEAESVKRARDTSSSPLENKDHIQIQHSNPEDANSDNNITPEKDSETGDVDGPHPQPLPGSGVNTAIIEEIISGIQSEDPTLQLSACRRLLCPKGDIPLPTLLYSLLDAVMDAKLVNRVLDFLTSAEEGDTEEEPHPPTRDPALVNVAAWVVSALARTEPKLLVGGGAIPILVTFLKAPSPPELTIPAAYALSALASISGTTDKRLFTSQLNDAATISALVDAITAAFLVDEEEEGSSELNLSLILSLTRLAKSLSFIPKNVAATRQQLRLLKCFVDICTKIPESETEIIFHGAWGLYYLTKSGNERDIQTLVHGGEHDIIPVLVRAVGSSLTTPTRRLLLPCLSLLGNVISSTVDSHTDAVLAAGLLPHLTSLMLEPSWTKEANWIVSNIAAGNVTQKEDLFQAGFFSQVMQVFAAATSEDDTGLLSGAKEAIFTIVNVMDKGSLEQKTWFLDNGILPSLVALLRKYPRQVLDPVRDSIYLLVKTFHPLSEGVDAENGVAPERLNLQQLLEESGTLLELSRYHDDEVDEEVWDRVSYILDVGLNNRHSWHI